MTKEVKIFSVVLAIVAIAWLVFGFAQFNGELGTAMFIEVFLPVLGAMAGLWIVVYAVSVKSWKTFLTMASALIVVWLGLWFLLD